MWSRCRGVMWLFGWGTFILSHHLAKFGVHRPCEIGDIKFLFVTWPWYWIVTWLCGWGPLILSHQAANFGFHRPYGTGNNSICNINSNSSSNAEVYKWPLWQKKFKVCYEWIKTIEQIFHNVKMYWIYSLSTLVTSNLKRYLDHWNFEVCC